MHADLESIVCKFGGDPAICLREEAICAKVYRRTDDGRRAIVLAHSWNEYNYSNQTNLTSQYNLVIWRQKNLAYASAIPLVVLSKYGYYWATLQCAQKLAKLHGLMCRTWIIQRLQTHNQ